MFHILIIGIYVKGSAPWINNRLQIIWSTATLCLPLQVASVLISLDGCIVWNTHNTVFGSKKSAICVQAVYFLHLTINDVTCLRLSDVSVICCVTYFQFAIQSAFLPYRSARPHSGTWFTQYRTSDVAENSGRFLVQPRKYFELILTVKWKLDIP